MIDACAIMISAATDGCFSAKLLGFSEVSGLALLYLYRIQIGLTLVRS